MQLFLEIFVAVLAVFGLYCAMRIFADVFLARGDVSVAVKVMTHEDAEDLPLLLTEAKTAFLCFGRCEVVLLVSNALMDGTLGVGEHFHEQTRELLEQYGVTCYLIDPDKGEE